MMKYHHIWTRARIPGVRYYSAMIMEVQYIERKFQNVLVQVP